MNKLADGTFVMFKHSGELRQIAHTEGKLLRFTDGSYMFDADRDLIEVISLREINEMLNILREIKRIANGNK